jgi:hypothetical protein
MVKIPNMRVGLDHQDPSPWSLSHCEVVRHRFERQRRFNRTEDLGCQGPSMITALAI